MHRIRRRVYTQEEKSLEVLLNRVKMYSKNGFFGFLDKETNVDIKKDIIDFDLSALPPQVKQLVMFSVLELISREIKKDKSPKVVLIDEGWSLLRSKEAESYVLEFIKTSRKYNASIGFITQEIEDLLRSESGKSILNTTSTKILLRQNSSNLELISRTLALNDKEKNYLLRAEKGQGLLITEHGRYEFIVNAPPLIHGLITTDPNEKKQVIPRKKRSKKQKKPKIDVSRGFYELKQINDEQRDILVRDGYVFHSSIFLNSSGSYQFMVKKQGKESAEHALLCWAIADEIRKRKGKAVVSATVEADVSAKIKNKDICFEVETGESLAFHGEKYIQEKIAERKKKYGKVIIVVTHRGLRTKYKHISGVQTIIRTEIVDTIAKLFK